jgi:hypothetical protein
MCFLEDMTFGAIETIAFVFAVVALIKIIVLFIDKNKWHKKVVKPAFENSEFISAAFLILSIFLLWVLLQEFTMVQIFAVLAFFGSLMGFGFFQYSKELMAFAEKAYKKEFDGYQLLHVLIWWILAMWVLFELLV